MHYMLTSCRLKDGVTAGDFAAAYGELVRHMQARGLVLDSGPVGVRERGNGLDTDERDFEHFAVMRFRDRAQIDAAYAHIERREAETGRLHARVMAMTSASSFLSWRDCEGVSAPLAGP